MTQRPRISFRKTNTFSDNVPRSVFCLPLIKQGKLVGILYLENNLAPGVFTPNRLAILELIASQAAISLEQARLYAELSEENRDRKQAQEALRASEERLQAIIDHTPAVILVKDLELGYVLVNREYERRYRVRRDQICGKSDFDIHPREVAEAVQANDRRVIEAGEPRQFEEVVPMADSERVYLAVKFLLRDCSGKPYAVCGIATDITDLKRAEELEAEMAREREMFLEEKTRLAGEIHDSLAQSFTGITMQLEMAKEVMTDRANEALDYVDRANDLARFGLAEARRSVVSLQPMTIKDACLIESLQMLAERSNIPGRLRCIFSFQSRGGRKPPCCGPSRFTANRARSDQQRASPRQINGHQRQSALGSTEPDSQSKRQWNRYNH